MIADLHLHYPMRVVQDLSPATTDQQVRKMAGHPSFGERAEALFIGLLGKFLNDRDPDSGYRVTVEGLEEGDVGVVCSVLYDPFDEMDLDKRYSAPPDPAYFGRLLDQLALVEQDVSAHAADAAVVHTGRARRRAGGRAVAVVHAVEGGFHLGPPERRPPRRRRARPARRRLHHAGAPVLAPRRDERAGAAVPAGLALPAAVPPAG